MVKIKPNTIFVFHKTSMNFNRGKQILFAFSFHKKLFYLRNHHLYKNTFIRFLIEIKHYFLKNKNHVFIRKIGKV